MSESRQLTQDLKQRIARSEYAVDPRRVAAAVIVRLALGEDALTVGRPRSGPSRPGCEGRPSRQAP
jgi:hypothetical protein